jgi:regulator of protease activity HflC (stomatin/prohibitin superfamily)
MNFATVLRGLVLVMWLVVIGLLVLAVVRASRGRKVRSISIGILVLSIAAVILTTISAGLVFIKPEERGVVISALAPKGYREFPLQPGLNWIIPYFEGVELYTVSRQNYTMSIAPLEGQLQGDDSVAARTSDGQEIFMDASVIYAIDPPQVIDLHINWQRRYTDEFIRPVSRGVIRDAVSQYGVAEVYSTERLKMTQQIEEELSRKLDENGLTLVDFVLRNITFSPEYAASVEQKQIAEQQAQQARFVVEQRKQEAEQARQVAQGRADAVVIDAEGTAEGRIIEANAEAQALEVIAAALQDNKDLLTYQYINKISPSIQTMLLPSGNPLYLPVPSLSGSALTQPILPTPEP